MIQKDEGKMEIFSTNFQVSQWKCSTEGNTLEWKKGPNWTQIERKSMQNYWL